MKINLPALFKRFDSTDDVRLITEEDIRFGAVLLMVWIPRETLELFLTSDESLGYLPDTKELIRINEPNSFLGDLLGGPMVTWVEKSTGVRMAAPGRPRYVEFQTPKGNLPISDKHFALPIEDMVDPDQEVLQPQAPHPLTIYLAKVEIPEMAIA